MDTDLGEVAADTVEAAVVVDTAVAVMAVEEAVADTVVVVDTGVTVVVEEEAAVTVPVVVDMVGDTEKIVTRTLYKGKACLYIRYSRTSFQFVTHKTQLTRF